MISYSDKRRCLINRLHRLLHAGRHKLGTCIMSTPFSLQPWVEYGKPVMTAAVTRWSISAAPSSELALRGNWQQCLVRWNNNNLHQFPGLCSLPDINRHRLARVLDTRFNFNPFVAQTLKVKHAHYHKQHVDGCESARSINTVLISYTHEQQIDVKLPPWHLPIGYGFRQLFSQVRWSTAFQ